MISMFALNKLVKNLSGAGMKKKFPYWIKLAMNKLGINQRIT